MAFPFAAVGLGVAGIATSIFGGNQQRDAARSQNKAQEKIAEKQFERAEKEWKRQFEMAIDSNPPKITESGGCLD